MKQIFQTSMALAKADFKLKNEGNYLGVLWYILDPLLMFSLFLLIRGILGAGIEYYPIYLVIGLTLFNFFSETTMNATRSIPNNENLISNLKIRQEVFVLSVLLRMIYAHLFEILIIAGFLLYFKLSVAYLIFYFPVLIVFSLFILGISFALSAISVYINDLGNLWGVFTRLLWFATPIFYSASMKLPFDFNRFNPMYHFITIVRDILIYHQMPAQWIIYTAVIESAAVFLTGYFIFSKAKASFAENL